MKQEDRELLIKDLSARLPYGVVVSCPVLHREFILTRIDRDVVENSWYLNGICEIDDCKPYLRPMESMTLEEYDELMDIPNIALYKDGKTITNGREIDWLDKKMFDYRGLIEKELALPIKAE